MAFFLLERASLYERTGTNAKQLRHHSGTIAAGVCIGLAGI